MIAHAALARSVSSSTNGDVSIGTRPAAMTKSAEAELKNSDKMRDDYDLSVCLLGPPKLASRFAYELRLLDEVGFAYRGPMLSATVEREQFWAQVTTGAVFIFLYWKLYSFTVSGISSAYSQPGGSWQRL